MEKEQKKIYVVVNVGVEDPVDVELDAAFDTREEAVNYKNQKEETYLWRVMQVPLGVPFDEKPVLWVAHMNVKDGIRKIDVDREELSLYGKEIGLLWSHYDNDMAIAFLAKNHDEADTFARLMFNSIFERQKVGWFRYLRQAIYQPFADDVAQLSRPYYNFKTGAIIMPEQGCFILSQEDMAKEQFQKVSGTGPYSCTLQKPMNYYDGFYSLLKKKEDGV